MLDSIKMWQKYQEDRKDLRLNQLVNNSDFVMFFKKGKEFFATNEQGRVLFAKLKTPDKDTSKQWRDEATFTAINLSKAHDGENAQNVFSKKDLNAIKIIDKEELLIKLTNKCPANLIDKDSSNRNKASNFITANEV